MTTALSVASKREPTRPNLLHWTFVVHVWTLAGVVFAALALQAILEGNMDRAARFLLLVPIVDFTDGTLARFFDIKDRMPLISGEIIDYIHDLVGLTFVPMFFYYQAHLFLPGFDLPLVIAAICAATLKYAMKPNALALGYSLGAPPIFLSLILFYFLGLPQWAATVYAIILLLLVLLPIRFPITSLVTTHWQPGWQSITNYMVAVFAVPIFLWLREAPRIIFWLLLANIFAQLTLFPILLRAGILKPGFHRRF